MDPNSPCVPSQAWLQMFIIIVNAVQALGIAYLAQRALRKNREDVQTHRERMDEQ